MATAEQIETLIEQLEKAPPSAHFQDIDQNAAGIRAILKFLAASDGNVTAGQISGHMKVSTARVAALLKKMEAQGLVRRDRDPADGRIVIVRLTDQGMQTVLELREKVHQSIGRMIDKVGMDRMLEFAAISNEIHSIMQDPEMEG